MSTTNTLPTGEMERLIDQRLDAIDRALLGLVPRQDRLSIVTQVEARLREVAGASGMNTAAALEQALGERATRPEADFRTAGETGAADRHRPISPAGRRRPWPSRRRSRLALASGVLGIVALALLLALPITYLVVSYADLFDEATGVLLGTHLAAVAIGGTFAVALSVAGLVRLQSHPGQMAGHGWAITGLCTGPLPMFIGGLMVLVVGLQLLATRSGNTVPVTTTSAAVTVPAPSYGAPPYSMANVPTLSSTPTAYPESACPNEVSGLVVEAPVGTMPGPARLAEPNPAEPLNAVEAVGPAPDFVESAP